LSRALGIAVNACLKEPNPRARFQPLDLPSPIQVEQCLLHHKALLFRRYFPALAIGRPKRNLVRPKLRCLESNTWRARNKQPKRSGGRGIHKPISCLLKFVGRDDSPNLVVASYKRISTSFTWQSSRHFWFVTLPFVPLWKQGDSERDDAKGVATTAADLIVKVAPGESRIKVSSEIWQEAGKGLALPLQRIPGLYSLRAAAFL